VAQFSQELSDIVDFFKEVKVIRDIIRELGFGKKDLEQISQIFEPVAKDSGSQLNIVAREGSTVVVNMSTTSMEANAVQNSLRRRIEAAPDTITGIQRDQVLYWYQVRADSAEKPGDRAIIERFSKRPVKVRFANDGVKLAMLNMPDNPFKKLYVVDVDVSTQSDKPVLYRILEVKESYDP
jgi:hypothetical protein